MNRRVVEYIHVSHDVSGRQSSFSGLLAAHCNIIPDDGKTVSRSLAGNLAYGDKPSAGYAGMSCDGGSARHSGFGAGDRRFTGTDDHRFSVLNGRNRLSC